MMTRAANYRHDAASVLPLRQAEAWSEDSLQELTQGRLQTEEEGWKLLNPIQSTDYNDGEFLSFEVGINMMNPHAHIHT